MSQNYFPISRRRCLGALIGGAAGAMGLAHGAFGAPVEKSDEKLPPVRAITKGPKHHWFGYYDKLEFDPTSRYVLGNEITFEHRAPRASDEIRIGMIDLADGDRWIELGKSSAFSWQQGCMLQWIPGKKSTVIWNDREGDHYVSRIVDVHKPNDVRTIPHPIYALHPSGKKAITLDFRRIQETRPGYGYAALKDPYGKENTPRDSGIWEVDLETGEQKFILSIDEVAHFGEGSNELSKVKHRFEHLLYNTDGSRIVFLNRFVQPRSGPKFRGLTRMLTVSPEGKDLFVVDPPGAMSHFVWSDPEHLLAWCDPPGHGKGFYIFKDRTPEVTQIGPGVMTVNGHCTYLPGNEWILNDTYPDADRYQHPFLYQVKTGKRFPLGHFYSPGEYIGEWRCDTHPRFSPDGKKVVIDSPHDGGRQMYLIDISGIVS